MLAQTCYQMSNWTAVLLLAAPIVLTILASLALNWWHKNHGG